VIVIGLMSGTSFDAVDAAAADLQLVGDTLHLRPLGMVTQPYPDELRRDLVAALPPGATTMEQVCRLDTGVGQAFAELAQRADHELCGDRAELVVSHGQTVFHWASGERILGTLQIGQPAWIAERTGLPVVSDLRSRDVAAGGQGAPLVSFLDVLWLRGRGRTCAALNLGGIANATVVDNERDPVAFDTGPANALIDAAVQHASAGRQTYDRGGALGAAGRLHPGLLAALEAEPYYARTPPKSTGKELFSSAYLQAAVGRGPDLSTADLVATLTVLTARTVAAALRPHHVAEVIASGGGTRNPTLMAMLRHEMPGVPVQTSDELGLPSGAKEAYAFAVLGFCTALGLASTVPSCTGARRASVLGSVTPGSAGLPRSIAGAVAPSTLQVHPSQEPG
jgi:anhydro-N-acetylmuramic acid kinase